MIRIELTPIQKRSILFRYLRILPTPSPSAIHLPATSLSTSPPFRNIWCQHYEACLDYVIGIHPQWTSFSCTTCSHKKNQEKRFELIEELLFKNKEEPIEYTNGRLEPLLSIPIPYQESWFELRKANGKGKHKNKKEEYGIEEEQEPKTTDQKPITK